MVCLYKRERGNFEVGFEFGLGRTVDWVFVQRLRLKESRGSVL